MDKFDGDITRILRAMKNGDKKEQDHLWDIVYAQLRVIARQRMRSERSDHTLSTTGLVHEAYFKLAGQNLEELEDRNEFYAFASYVMRQVLIDHARKKKAQKNNNGQKPAPLEDALHVLNDEEGRDWAWLIDLSVALDELEEIHPRWAKVVVCRYFGGMTFKEIGEVIEKNPRTAERDWQLARKWLYNRLNDPGPIGNLAA